MSKPPALAPTIELAEPRVKRFADHIAKYMDMQIHEFYACEPCEHYMQSGYGDKQEKWTEGWWALMLLGNDFSPTDLPSKNSIDVELMGVQLKPVGMVVSLLLSARVMR